MELVEPGKKIRIYQISTYIVKCTNKSDPPFVQTVGSKLKLIFGIYRLVFKECQTSKMLYVT